MMGEATKSLNAPFQLILEAYKDKGVLNFVDRSKVEYVTTVSQFLFFLQDRGVHDLKTVGANTIKTYLSHLDGQGLSTATRRAKLMMLRSFLDWLVDTDYIGSNFAMTVIPPERIDLNPRVLTEKEVKTLLMVIQKPRDQAIANLLLYTGIKLGELVRLRLSDLNVPKRVISSSWGTMRIIGVGRKKTRVLLLNKDVCEVLVTYLRKRPIVESDAVFLSKYKKFLGHSQIKKLIANYFKMAWIQNASVNTLRHTFAVRQLEKGMESKALQKLMGLSSRNSMLVYRNIVKV